MRTNDNAIYVITHAKYFEEIFRDIFGAFPLLDLKATFVTYNCINAGLELLLVLKNGGEKNQAAVIEILQRNQRIT